MEQDYYINGRFLTQTISGVQRFALEIVTYLVKQNPKVSVLVPNTSHEIPQNLKPFIEIVGSNEGTKWEQVDLYAFMKKRGAILLNLCNTAPLRYRNNAITIHDLGVFENPKWYSKKFALWYKFMTPRIVKHAKAVFTVSEFSKHQIATKFGKPLDQIYIAYNGVSTQVLEPNGPVEKDKLFLHVGTFSERKNVSLIIAAFQAAKTDGYKLVLCGNFDGNIVHSNDFIGLKNIEIKTNVTDSELSELYGKAQFLICASKYEGFGIPILEALYHNIIPVISDIPVFRELYGEHAIFFNPSLESELVSRIEDVTLDPPKPNKMSSEMREKYNYERSALTINQSLCRKEVR